MNDTTFIQVRIDRALKQNATDVLDSIGMDMPNAIRMFLKRVVLENGLPFEAKYPTSAGKEAASTLESKKRREPIIVPAQPSKSITMDEYVALLNKIPTGKITRLVDIEHFFEKKYDAAHVRIEFSANTHDPLWNNTPIWREVSKRGMLINRTVLDRDAQARMLENEGFSIVPCGANNLSLKVENYMDYLFDFSL